MKTPINSGISIYKWLPVLQTLSRTVGLDTVYYSKDSATLMELKHACVYIMCKAGKL